MLASKLGLKELDEEVDEAETELEAGSGACTGMLVESSDIGVSTGSASEGKSSSSGGRSSDFGPESGVLFCNKVMA